RFRAGPDQNPRMFLHSFSRAARLEMKMPDDRRRYVHKNLFTPHLVRSNVVADDPAHPVQPAAFPAIDERSLDLPDEHVLVITQDPPGPKQSLVDPEDLPYLRRRKVVERQARDDVIVNSL